MTCYLYIMECHSIGSHPIKIGIASNPERRVEEMQTGCPWPIQLKMKIPMKSRMAALDLELFLHKRFHKQRMCGEWFTQKKMNLPKAFDAYQKKIGGKVSQEYLGDKTIYGSKVRSREAAESIEKELDRMIDLSWI